MSKPNWGWDTHNRALVAYITAELLDALLAMAEDADPSSVSIRLAVTSASDLGVDGEVDPSASVFDELYFPGSGDSVAAVFGVDVSVPPGQTPGAFVSHPDGDASPQSDDPVSEVVFVAVPPYTPDDVAAYDRRGDAVSLTVLERA